MTASKSLDWETVPVRDLGEIRLGRQRSPYHQSGRHTTPYLRVANVYDGWIDYTDVLAMDFTPAERKTYNLRPGDILLNEGQDRDLVGRCAVYDGEPDEYCFQNTLIRLRCNDSVLPSFCRAVFKLWLDTGRFAEVARQTTSIAHLGVDRFAGMPFARPRLDVQRRITGILDSADEAIRQTEAVIAKLRQMRAGLLHDLLTRALNAQGQLRDPSTHPEKFRECALGELTPLRRERGQPGLPTMAVTMHDGLQPRNESDRRVETRLRPEQHLLARKGDIVYNMMRMWQGACGLANEDCLLSPAYVVVVPTGVVPAFAYILLKSPETVQEFHNRSRGLTADRLRLYHRDFAGIVVRIPNSLSEQQAIVDVVESHDTRIRAEEAYRDKLKLQKQGLTHDLLTGRVRV